MTTFDFYFLTMNYPKIILSLLTLLIISCNAPEDIISLYLIGDSTMADKAPDKSPETGWGQVLQEYFTAEVRVINHAVNGRSTKSFIDEGRWDQVLDSLKKEDYVCIQFGHNDEKEYDPERFTNPVTGYRNNLIRFITDTRDKGASPILATPIVRRSFNEQGTLMDTHGTYPLIMHEVSYEYNVPLVDLQLQTEELVVSLGEEDSKQLYNWLDPGENDNYPDGRQDNTHLNRKGAYEVARLFTEDIIRQDIPLKEYLVNTFQTDR